MLSSVLKKVSGNTNDKERRKVTFSRENSFIESKDVKSQDGKEEILSVATLKLDNQSRDDKEDGMIGGVGDEGADSIEERKGKKLVPTDSLRRHRERFSKTLED